MKLTQLALQKINDPKIRVRLQVALSVTEQTIIRYIKANKEDLTMAAALAVIREETGLTDEEILEESNGVAA